MRKHAVLFTLALLEMAGLVLSAFFWFVMRRDLLATFGTGAVPLATNVALSAWFIPATAFAGVAMTMVAMLPGLRTRVRTFLAGAGLVITVFGLALAIWVSYLPAFEQLGGSPDGGLPARALSRA
jgi:hypothetical protein